MSGMPISSTATSGLNDWQGLKFVPRMREMYFVAGEFQKHPQSVSGILIIIRDGHSASDGGVYISIELSWRRLPASQR
jgi:hypothetical protein